MRNLLEYKNVVGYGFGKKIREGIVTDTDCITVMVTRKMPAGYLLKEDIVPVEVGNKPTDIIETGEIRALASRTDRWRPAPGGVSIGHYAITAGTFGSVVIDNETGRRVILSNNHVLANSNDANIGDVILQPGPYDGGTGGDQIATLLRFVPIQFGGGGFPTCPIVKAIVSVLNGLARLYKSSHRVYAQKISAAYNFVDAAIAMPIADNLILDEIFEIGTVSGEVRAEIGMDVKKSGRTTGLTFGKVTILSATVQVSYGSGKMATFSDQIVLGAGMSQGGDSGSMVVSSDNRAVGLLFAGSNTTTIVSPMFYVRELLGVSL